MSAVAILTLLLLHGLVQHEEKNQLDQLSCLKTMQEWVQDLTFAELGPFQASWFKHSNISTLTDAHFLSGRNRDKLLHHFYMYRLNTYSLVSEKNCIGLYPQEFRKRQNGWNIKSKGQRLISRIRRNGATGSISAQPLKSQHLALRFSAVCTQ